MQDFKIGVVGLGTMGLGIAQVYAQAGFRTFATDLSPEARASALTRLAQSLAPRVEAGKLSPEERDAILSRLHVVETPQDLAPCGLIIEAVVERLDAKQSLFRVLEAVIDPEAILATNTSSLPVSEIAAGCTRPERVLGLHFFNPAPVMKLVELIPHASTGAMPLELARHATEAAGKTVIAAPDRPGFIVNRVARPFYGEALAMAGEGIAPARIDAAMLAAGYRLGPFALIDLIGADVHLAATEGVWRGMGEHPRYTPFPALGAQVASGALGRKTGRGFVFPEKVVPEADDAILLRIEATLANEAASLADEGIPPADIDTALKLALNFPRGPFEPTHSFAELRAELARLHALHPTGRYTISPTLERLA